MKGKKSLVAVVSVVILLSVVQVANAVLPDYTMGPEKLKGYCYEKGGQYFPPGVGGAYACLLPDGTLVSCGGTIPICTETRSVQDGHLSASESIILSMQLDIIKKLDDLASQVRRECSGGVQRGQ
jgi:hypothetical protein